MKTMVKQLEENQKIDDFFICSNKIVRTDKNGNKYLLLRLTNSSGTIAAVKWRADELADTFEQGQVIKLTGSVKRNDQRKQLEIDVQNITPVDEDSEIDPSTLQEVSPRDFEIMQTEFREIRGDITNPHLTSLLQEIFTEDMYRAFCQAPAAKGFHHNYIHGLLEHSISVSRVAGAIAGQYEDVNRDLLVTGAILHDIGKTVEFNYRTAIDYSDPGRLIGHIVLGEKMVADAIARLEAFPEELALQLLHMILSHHGEKEYGSPIRPKTPEAFILNHADDIDAKANVFQKKRSQSAEPWSEFNRPLDRFLYLRKVEE